ncbi:endonuclease/exonuclease/phosphatase family protein [Phytoactinopolyspora alkaliphila]|uniref:Endonuclease/exonuclease/phosphatase family protein n=1 Tax=Phytoactinopolyspora alkaliphila TaxID=1783498 RepID=A0A6N9YPP7_9ACTN|nr:endonuclease/exonuclease/phosphatase family protein [Phytoactinopolyspora alkaliphila]NED96818.1 endonuclease/exonuclease/phosphatase family protein [Phytoactinopolyspora alkaliphila]
MIITRALGGGVVTVATFNVENLFARPKAFDPLDWSAGEPILRAYGEFNTLIANNTYTDADRERMRDLLVELGVYYRNTHGAIRRRPSQTPAWAWLRKNRGSFDREPRDATESVEIIAAGRDDWIGWLELATEPTDEIGTRMTANVISDVDADIIAVIEAEDRPALARFNHEMLDRTYRHVMLVDGNDERGIDVGVMTKPGFPIGAIRSNVDTEDATGTVFSRDCPQYEITTPAGTVIHVLINHFKSQSGGGGEKRKRQADAVRGIVDELVGDGEHVIVLGDLNEGQPKIDEPPINLANLFDSDGPLISCYDLDGFDTGDRPGTFDTCSIRSRLDYILISHSLQPAFRSGHVFRKGLWGIRKTRPTAWDTYPEMTAAIHQASDHAAVVIDLDT